MKKLTVRIFFMCVTYTNVPDKNRNNIEYLTEFLNVSLCLKIIHNNNKLTIEYKSTLFYCRISAYGMF